MTAEIINLPRHKPECLHDWRNIWYEDDSFMVGNGMSRCARCGAKANTIQWSAASDPTRWSDE